MSLVGDLFLKGQKLSMEEHDEKEKAKVGTLRGGSVGMLDEFGNFAGTCAAQAYLRFKGISSDPITSSRDLMFQGGRLNEDGWYEYLRKAWEGPILREEEIPTCWETSQGIKVTGRPDVVLCEAVDKSGPGIITQPDDDLRIVNYIKPIVGVELKQVMSLWTARDVLFNKSPKTNHLMQAAHYSWQLGVPFELWYTNRTDFAITGDWCKGLFPKYQADGSEHCQYSFQRIGPINPRTGRPSKSKINQEEFEILKVRGEEALADVLKTLPFIQGYQLKLEEGQLLFRDAMVEDAEWKETVINVKDIERFYNHIPDMKEVPPEPLNVKYNGEAGNYNLRDYCSLGNLCCAYNKGKHLDSWVDRVKLQVKDKK